MPASLQAPLLSLGQLPGPEPCGSHPQPTGYFSTAAAWGPCLPVAGLTLPVNAIPALQSALQVQKGMGQPRGSGGTRRGSYRDLGLDSWAAGGAQVQRSPGAGFAVQGGCAPSGQQGALWRRRGGGRTRRSFRLRAGS